MPEVTAARSRTRRRSFTALRADYAHHLTFGRSVPGDLPQRGLLQLGIGQYRLSVNSREILETFRVVGLQPVPLVREQ